MNGPVISTDEPVDIGHGVSIEIHRVDGVAFALTEHHADPSRPVDAGASANCNGYVRFDNEIAARVYGQHASPRWKVESLEPLTLSPSVLCRSCGHHGYIRGGKWVPA